MDWRRIAEGVAVTGMLVASLALFGNPRQALDTIESVRTVPYAGALAGTLLGMVIWSGTLSALLRAQGVAVDPGRFQTTFVAGMGIRSVVPGGSASGPAVLGYVVGRTTDAPVETAVAMAYVQDVLLWVGATAVGTAGILGLLLFHHPSAQVLELAAGLTVLTLVMFGVVGYGILNPEPVERVVDALVTRLHDAASGVSERAAAYLDPEAVDDSLDRFFGAFRRLADDPEHLGPALASAVAGWFVHATTLYLVFVAVDVHASYAAAIFVVPVGGLAEGLSVLPGGIGSVEPAFTGLIVLLTSAGFTTSATVVFLYRLSNYWFRLGVGFAALPALGIGDVLDGAFDEPEVEA